MLHIADGYKIVGLGHSSGEYEGHAYNNMMVHTLYEDEKIDGNGVKTVKVKYNVFVDSGVKIGDIVNFYYDEWRRVQRIEKIKL